MVRPSAFRGGLQWDGGVGSTDSATENLVAVQRVRIFDLFATYVRLCAALPYLTWSSSRKRPTAWRLGRTPLHEACLKTASQPANFFQHARS